jgi:hypothetical protein
MLCAGGFVARVRHSRWQLDHRAAELLRERDSSTRRASDRRVTGREEAESAVSASRSETGRVEAFSDGVFAIVITLFILGIQMPDALTSDAGL